MKTSTIRLTVVLLAIGALVFGGAAQAMATPKDAGCHQTPYGTTGHGANKGGAYDDTCDGSPSLNGNGNGKATGKPCAGCVGKADEKNPPGQAPDGSDDNNGYECDGNSGVGKTNPAHTGCSNSPPPPPPPPGCTVDCDDDEPLCTTNCGGTPPTEVLGRRVVRGQQLAATGVPIGGILALAMFALVLGTVMTRVSARSVRTAEVKKNTK